MTAVWLSLIVAAFFAGSGLAWWSFRRAMRYEARMAILQHDQDMLDSLKRRSLYDWGRA